MLALYLATPSFLEPLPLPSISSKGLFALLDPLCPFPKCLTLLWEAVRLANADYVEIPPLAGSFLHLPASFSESDAELLQHFSESDAPILPLGKLLQNRHLSLTVVH